MPNWTGKWKGGRTYLSESGATVWVLRRQVAGRRVEIRLDVSSETDAELELRAFDKDPSGYSTQRGPVRALGQPVRVDGTTVEALLKYLTAAKQTPEHVADMGRYLSTWVEDLSGYDLRSLRAIDLRRMVVARDTAQQKRIAAIKTLTAWLRSTGRLESKDDPTRDLLIPQARPEKTFRRKGYQASYVEEVYAALVSRPSLHHEAKVDRQPVRDLLCAVAKTGMHYREVRKLTDPTRDQMGVAALRREKGQGEIAGVLTVHHKKNAPHVQSVDLQTWAALVRLWNAGGPPSTSTVYKVMREVADQLEHPDHLLLGELRHSFANWLRASGREVVPKAGAGLSIEKIQAALGHAAGSRVTAAHYLDDQHVPSMMTFKINLVNVEDPPLLGEFVPAPRLRSAPSPEAPKSRAARGAAKRRQTRR